MVLHHELNQFIDLKRIVDEKLPWQFYDFLLRIFACGWAPCYDSHTVCESKEP